MKRAVGMVMCVYTRVCVHAYAMCAKKVLSVAEQISAALEFLHANSLVHLVRFID